jgi:pilus assembly protein CpaC
MTPVMNQSIPAIVAVLMCAGAGSAAQAPATATASTTTPLSPAAPAQPPRAVAPGLPAAPVQRIVLTAGRSTVLTTDFDITRIAVTNPAVADAVVVQPHEVLIDGKGPGTVSLIVWGSDGRRQYDVVVDPGVSALEQRLQSLFPGEDVQVSVNDEAIILSGHVSSNAVSLRAAEIAASTAANAKVVNLLQLPGGSESQQVLLQVRFAEVSRRALMELGASLFTGPNGYKDYVARSTTQQFAAPGYINRIGPPPPNNPTDEGKFTFSDFLNLFLFNTKYDLGAVIRALETKGLFQSLAEPNLIAYNGQEASFLAGGEIPIPVVQGLSNAVTVQFKEFGIRLNFRPTIAGDTIRLKVRPEVSTLDFPNGIILSGFRVPALATRRAETDVELRDGQSFAIAGLLSNLSQDDIQAVPALSKLPIIGYLFKSKSIRAERTELMVLITPTLVRPLNPDEVPPLPTIQKRFLPSSEGIGDEMQGGGGIQDGPDVASRNDPSLKSSKKSR